MDLSKYTNDELRNLIQDANLEMTKRYNRRKEELWLNVKNALREYITEFGDITFDHESSFIDENSTFEDIGYIGYIGMEEDDY